MSFNAIKDFENEVSNFFGAPYGIAVDCCTHAIELCLIYNEAQKICVPHRTYISIPFLSKKLNINLEWKNIEWQDYYYLTDNIIDAAVLWKENSYIKGTFMCISFQFRKHLSLGRGGIILTDNEIAARELRKMSYDGRDRDIPWRLQDFDTIGYHYYMTPEVAELGLKKLPKAIKTTPMQWIVTDWPDLTQKKIFKT